MRRRYMRGWAVALLAAAALFCGGPGEPGGAFAQDLERDRERLRSCDPAREDCERLREQVTEQLRDRVRDCDPATQDCDRLRTELQEMERARDRDRTGGGGRGGGAGGGGGGGGGGGRG